MGKIILQESVGFNTASVLIQHILFIPAIRVFPFQYSFCSYSTDKHGKWIHASKLFQYSFCSYSTRIWRDYSYLLCSVSIQLLFLFNDDAIAAIADILCFNTASVLIQLLPGTMQIKCMLFQYSFCSYSTFSPVFQLRVVILFQYSFCSYSTHQDYLPVPVFLQFQYSFCSYSTERSRVSFPFSSVSIQLLFLFNCHKANW